MKLKDIDLIADYWLKSDFVQINKHSNNDFL